MSAEVPVIDPTAFDFSKPIAGIEEIRAVNPHRYEFEMLSGIVHVDRASHTIVGYKDTTPNDFWARGHMPGFPLLPGVLMCEAGAQLSGYYYTTQKIGDPGVLLGLGGIDEVKFVRQVRPGERLVLVGIGIKVHRRLTRFRVTGFVGTERTFEALITGVPLGKLEELRGA
ncbi:3-hydroxyacyl-[acyl-carrier-protein] dehydratase FabZ [Gemmata sp. SH-PL17]|uniref:Beta-hydroxyacyl-ACP dehydratase n=1 Tax=Gemmata massiliana TaxID=1210884 RepID=A0A6P2D328_9BACT|nr:MULTISPECIES: 3-hydroxyacyl-ACP dehydratase FabZ family protein [Gemmata]AMV27168.1 3-hydroxyacyl-[acyl-carrier-protein] dehydratase FabZ [Gemmata sp. SH-PL17]VTR95277.1 Beta-hydroxyacyl-(Acyl-carrier-protein) dehydratase FabA/FabZ OS=Isosphaera pallida (strain ATCC 43644 / DSM 9630 / IS1B) GN=Isop_0858 PE=4 SV=1: FabA [Gemmata massiliana]